MPRLEGAPLDRPENKGRTHDADLSRHDRVSICLDVDRDYTTWYEFQVDQRGLSTESCWDDRRWNPTWYVATGTEDSHWRIEAAIPWTELTTEQREFQATKMAIHAAMVDRMDQEIGRVLAQVKAMGAMENTLVIFLSDNGASAEIMVRGDGNDLNAAPGSEGSFLCLGPGFSSAANTPFRRHKTWVHEGGIATPFIVQWPKGIAAHGELRHNPGHLIDIVPTVLEIAGGKPLENWEGKPVPAAPGRSLVPAFAKDNTVPHDYLWWMHEANRALRVGDWKIVAAGKDAPWELYDLRTDRAESVNLAAKQPERVKEMAATWEKHTEEFRALALKDLPPDAGNKPNGKKKKKGDDAE